MIGFYTISLVLGLFFQSIPPLSYAQSEAIETRFDAYDGLPEAGISKLLFDQINRPVLLDSTNQVFVLRSGKFKKAPGLPSSLRIRDIVTGPDKLIWLTDDEGRLFSFDPIRYTSTNYFPISSITGKITGLYAAEEALLVVSGQRLFEISRDRMGKLPGIYSFGDLPFDGMPLSFHLVGGKRLLADKMGSIWEYDPENEHWSAKADPQGSPIRSIHLTEHALTYITRDSSIYQEIAGEETNLKLPPGMIQSFSRVWSPSVDSLWLIGDHGFHLMVIRKDSLVPSGFYKLDQAANHLIEFSGGEDSGPWLYNRGVLQKLSKDDLKKGMKIPSTKLDRVASPHGNGRWIFTGSGNLEVYGGSVQFAFSKSDENLRFRHRLEGKRSFDWTDFKKDSDINYEHLPSGDYILKTEVIHPSGLTKVYELPLKVRSKLWINLPRWLLWGLIFLLVTLILVMVSHQIRQKREAQKLVRLRSKLNQLEAEMKALQLQINPHFIFNFLAGIKGLIQMGKTDVAAKYTGLASGVMRKLLDSSQQQWLPLVSELNLMKEFVAIENFRTGKSIAFRVNGEYGDDIHIPPLFLQPLIENAMQHAFRGRKTGTIEIYIEVKGRFLKFKVRDSGVGIDNEKNTDNIHALQILEERLKLYIQDSPGNIWSIQSEKGFGTEIDFILPFKRI